MTWPAMRNWRLMPRLFFSCTVTVRDPRRKVSKDFSIDEIATCAAQRPDFLIVYSTAALEVCRGCYGRMGIIVTSSL